MLSSTTAKSNVTSGVLERWALSSAAIGAWYGAPEKTVGSNHRDGVYT